MTGWGAGEGKKCSTAEGDGIGRKRNRNETETKRRRKGDGKETDTERKSNETEWIYSQSVDPSHVFTSEESPHTEACSRTLLAFQVFLHWRIPLSFLVDLDESLSKHISKLETS